VATNDLSTLLVQEGDNLSAKSWNTLVHHAESPPVSVGPGLNVEILNGQIHITLASTPNGKWVGKVVAAGPNGEADFTTNVYWVSRCYTDTSGDPNSSANRQQVIDYKINTDAKLTVAATNIAENGTHNLGIGSFIEVSEIWDNGNPATLRFQFFTANLPVGQYQYMNLQMTSQNQNQVGFDFTRAHPLL
jgi:hypothetical protein